MLEGTNNMYKVKKSQKQQLAVTEQAILESMHVATFFNILATSPDLDFMSQINDSVILFYFIYKANRKLETQLRG